MPLIKSGSKQAFKQNIRREIAAGKPQKQAAAIAYSVQRKHDRGFCGHTSAAEMQTKQIHTTGGV